MGWYRARSTFECLVLFTMSLVGRRGRDEDGRLQVDAVEGPGGNTASGSVTEGRGA